MGGSRVRGSESSSRSIFRPLAAPSRSANPTSRKADLEAEYIHTIEWDDELRADISRLPRWLTEWDAVEELKGKSRVASMSAKGKCVLTTFPRITLETGETRLATASELCVLVAILLDMTCMRLPKAAKGLRQDNERNPDRGELELVMEAIDMTGERPVHALQLASGRAGGSTALQLVYTMFTMFPRLMGYAHMAPQSHFDAAKTNQLFLGENCMHIAAVNRQERLLCAMINLSDRLNKTERTELFTSKCEGPFFRKFPQCFYGGSVLAFAAVHELKNAVHLLSGEKAQYTGGLNGKVGNERPDQHYCKLTGFLPIHAVVASGRVEMAEFLTRENLDSTGATIAFTRRAHPHEETIFPAPSMRALASEVHLAGLSALTPLQLAVKLGHMEMFRHLLRWHHTEILWEWGERRAYAIDLREIDCPTKNNDCLSLCSREDATDSAHQMLSSEFMRGFIWNLFVDKWNNYARTVHLVLAFVSFCMFGILVYVMFSLKLKVGRSDGLSEADIRLYYFASGALVLFFFLRLILEVSSVISYILRRTDLTPWNKLVECFRCLAHAYWNMLAIAFNLGGCGILFAVIGHEEWHSAGKNDTALSETPGVFHTIEGHTSNQAELLWTLLSLGILCQAIDLLETIFSVFHNQGVFFLTVVSMLKNDIITFAPVFGAYILIFWLALFSIYPTETMGSVDAFEDHSPLVTLTKMVSLALTGETLMIKLYDDSGNETWNLSPTIACNFWLFYIGYITFIALTVILLLNLLIARMNSTYGKIEASSVIEWRTMFARRVIRLENTIITKLIPHVQINSGKLQPDGSFKCFKETALATLPDGRRNDPNFFNLTSETEEDRLEQGEVASDDEQETRELSPGHPEPVGADLSQATTTPLPKTRQSCVTSARSSKLSHNASASPGASTYPALISPHSGTKTRHKKLGCAIEASHRFQISGRGSRKKLRRMPVNRFASLRPGYLQQSKHDEKQARWMDFELDEWFPLEFGRNARWTDGSGKKFPVGLERLISGENLESNQSREISKKHMEHTEGIETDEEDDEVVHEPSPIPIPQRDQKRNDSTGRLAHEYNFAQVLTKVHASTPTGQPQVRPIVSI